MPAQKAQRPPAADQSKVTKLSIHKQLDFFFFVKLDKKVFFLIVAGSAERTADGEKSVFSFERSKKTTNMEILTACKWILLPAKKSLIATRVTR
jgi:hypothetical protein